MLLFLNLLFFLDFEGIEQCFLFTLRPSVNFYSPTGKNQNFVYLNHGQETLPNGFVSQRLNLFCESLSITYFLPFLRVLISTR